MNAHPGFYALWADGDALKPSESSRYFTDREPWKDKRWQRCAEYRLNRLGGPHSWLD